MKATHQAHGRISDHFEGMGTVTRDMVIERAREIAMINGHPTNHYTLNDFMEAKRELTGEETDLENEESIPSAYEAQRNELPDENTIYQDLVEQGVSEAEHDQMVEAAKHWH